MARQVYCIQRCKNTWKTEWCATIVGTSRQCAALWCMTNDLDNKERHALTLMIACALLTLPGCSMAQHCKARGRCCTITTVSCRHTVTWVGSTHQWHCSSLEEKHLCWVTHPAALLTAWVSMGVECCLHSVGRDAAQSEHMCLVYDNGQIAWGIFCLREVDNYNYNTAVRLHSAAHHHTFSVPARYAARLVRVAMAVSWPSYATWAANPSRRVTCRDITTTRSLYARFPQFTLSETPSMKSELSICLTPCLARMALHWL